MVSGLEESVIKVAAIGGSIQKASYSNGLIRAGNFLLVRTHGHTPGTLILIELCFREITTYRLRLCD